MSFNLRYSFSVSDNKQRNYRVSKKNWDLEPETSLKSLMLRKLLDQYTGPYLTLSDLTGPYWVLLGLTGPYWALLGLTGPYWALLGLTGPCRALFCIC